MRNLTMQLFIEALTIIILFTAIMVTLFAWLRQDISVIFPETKAI